MTDRREALFTELKLRNLVLPNRTVRSGTYEGWGDADGVPRSGLTEVHSELARGGVGTIITGFVYISQVGRSMHPGQCGIESDDKITPWRALVSEVRKASSGVKLAMQIAHNGRQTRQNVTGQPVVGASGKACTYFRQRVRALDDAEIREIISDFAAAAHRAQQAGLDAVQIHAAHGYLLHQFLSPWTNTRKDCWADGPLLLEEIIHAVRAKCGESFPILVKLSASEDNTPGVRIEDTIRTAKRLDALGIDAIEISYGTMEYALSIIRGAVPIDTVLKVNPMYKDLPGVVKSLWKRFCYPSLKRKLIPFSENYNLQAAARVKKEVATPIIAVGGFRSPESMIAAVADGQVDAISLCRPLICEPDLPGRILSGDMTYSRCTNCNLCTIHCDSREPLRCYQKKVQ